MMTIPQEGRVEKTNTDIDDISVFFRNYSIFLKSGTGEPQQGLEPFGKVYSRILRSEIYLVSMPLGSKSIWPWGS